MSTALTKIINCARQLKKQKPGAKWTNLVKQAGAEYRAGRLGAATKKVSAKKKFRQTGTTNKKNDQARKAKRPGVRTSSSGVRYTERRKNRSDVPGSLTGSGLRSEVKTKLSNALLAHELATTIKATKEARQRIIKYRKILKSL